MRCLKWLLLAGLCVALAVLPACSPEPSGPPEPQRGKLLAFTQPGCQPCAKSKKELAGRRLSVPVEWVDISVRHGEASHWSIVGTPTYVLLDDGGKEVARESGYLTPAQLQRWLDRQR